ncbi:MAG TPA: prolyl oligopeptidase family serine peptidase [Candidatus Limnocylindria bacterium]|nr:prolyl oligopeptidase family serine peptidase [Candidatus Limnocylindria bacterium]
MKLRAVVTFIFLTGYTLGRETTWVNPQPTTLGSYVYAPAVLASEILMGRYCPKFIASTGECITCSKGIEVLRLPATSGNLAEIKLKPDAKYVRTCKRTHKKRKRGSFFISLLTAPFRALWYTASYLSNFVLGFSVKKCPTPHEESLSSYCIDPTKVNLAQEEDLRLFKGIYDKHLHLVKQQHPDQQHALVLYGTSRGSATVFNFCALEKPKEVRAVVCEGLFDSIDHIYQVTKSAKTRFMIRVLYKISQFKKDGILPIKVAEDMPLDMPVLLITSRKDITVPWQCTMAVYNKLRETGHNNVHILVLKKAGHAWYPYCKKNERALYQNVVHAFYKKYNLPYIAEYAEDGWDYFTTQTQPDVTE